MILRCAACGFVNQQVDEETAFCPNCGNPYTFNPDAPTVAATPSFAPNRSYAPGYPSYPPDSPSYPPDAPPYGTSGYRPPLPTPQPLSPKRARISGFVAGMLVALGIVVLGICSLAALAASRGHATSTAQTATATPNDATTSTPVVLQTYTDPSGYFMIQYPALWSFASAPIPNLNGPNTLFASEATSLKHEFDILVTPAPLTTDLLPSVVTSGLVNGTEYTQTNAPSYITINAIKWHVVGGTFTASDGHLYHASELVVHHGTHTFAVFLVTPETEYQGFYRSIFARMLTSFAFGPNA
jgi:hypothetical protein